MPARTGRLWPDLVEPLILALLAPVALFPTPHRFVLLLAIPAVWVWEWRRTGHIIVRTPLDWLALAMLWMLGIGSLVSYNPLLGLPASAGLIYGLGLYYGIVRLGLRARFRRAALGFFLLSGAGLAVLGLLGARDPYNLSRFLPLTSGLPAFFAAKLAEDSVSPNEVAGAVVWVAPLLAVSAILLLRRLGSGRRLAGNGWYIGLTVAILLMLGATLLSLTLMQSRGGDLGLGLAAMMMILIALPARPRTWAAAALAILGLLSAALVAVVIGPAEVYRWIGYGVGSVADRLEIWGRAVYLIQDFPLTGMGMHTFSQAVHVFFPMQRIGPQRFIDDAHNEFLQAGLDLGLPGLVAFVALNLASLWMIFKVWRDRHTRLADQGLWDAGWVALGLGGGLVAHLIYGLTDAVALGAQYGFIFWVMLALTTSLYQQTRT